MNVRRLNAHIMVFKLKSLPPGEDFHWNRKMYHLTYAGWVSLDLVLSTIAGATNIVLVGYSVVHEEADDDEEDEEDEDDGEPRGYRHTHVALIFLKRLNLRGARKFDVFADHPDGVRIHHPHVAARCSMSHMEEIFTRYHPGSKYDIKTGKNVYKKPVFHSYKLPQDFEFHAAIMAEILEARNLVDACLAGNIRPRNVSDVRTLRAEAAKMPKHFEHKFAKDSFLKLISTPWSCLDVYGRSGTGKTKWALAQFVEPFVCKPFNSIGHLEKLKQFDPNFHDGIVLDECDLSFMSREEVIALVDPDEAPTINVRFGSFTLPAGVKKIFVGNPPPQSRYPADPWGAISRRMTYLGPIESPTYKTAQQDIPIAALDTFALAGPGLAATTPRLAAVFASPLTALMGNMPPAGARHVAEADEIATPPFPQLA